MVYVGGKIALQRYLCPIIQSELDTGQYEKYIEPFGGGANIISLINFTPKYYYDINNELVEFFKAIQSGWQIPLPNSFDSAHYNEVKESFLKRDNKFPLYYYGYMMTIPSYNGKIWGGFAKNTSGRNYQQEHYNNIIKQLDSLKDVIFDCKSYQELNPKNSLIYCDIPYHDSKDKKYYNENFNYNDFYNWCKEKSKTNKILISETYMPEEFKIIWEKPVKRTLANQSNGKHAIEKLYTI